MGRPSPATVIAIAAFVFATGGYAVAGPKSNVNKDEVALTTLIGGPTDTIDPGTPAPIPLGAGATFTQKAGESLLVTVTGDFEALPGLELCDAEVTVKDQNNGADLGMKVVELWERGFEGQFTDSEIVPAPAADKEWTLEAFAHETTEAAMNGSFECDDEDPTTLPPDTGDDTYRVNVRITVIHLRN